MMQHTIRHLRALWQRRHWVSAGFFLSVLVVGSFVPYAARAATEEFTIVAVGVDMQSELAAAKALEYARMRAVYLAMRKLGVAHPDQAVAKLTEADLALIIRGSTVLQTRRDNDHSYEEVSVTIVDDALRSVLKMSPAATEPEAARLRSILVLPVLVTDKGPTIWKNDNLLRPPLTSELLHQGHGAIILASGDMQDLRLIDGENVSKVTADELKPMFERYGAEEIIIALLTLGEGDQPSQVLLRRLGPQNPRDEALTIPPVKPDDPTPLRLTHAAQNITTAVMQIASSTAQNEADKLAKATKIPATFLYTTPKDYARMAAAVRQSPGVLLLELPAIGLNNVTGTIYLTGDKSALHKALAAQAIVVREQDSGWTLTTR